MASPDTAPAPADLTSRASSQSRKRSLLMVGAMLAVLAGGFYLGMVYAESSAANDVVVRRVIGRDSGKDPAVDFALFWQVWDKLHERYVDNEELDAEELVYGAIHGMVGAAGDPYTSYFEPVEAKKFEEEVSGAFSGVGMEIGKRDGIITVIAPIRDSPAMKAGILAGDRVYQVDGADTDGWTVEEAVSRIRGERGTVVVLLIGRGDETPREFRLTRDVIRIPAVEWKMLNGDTAYVQILTFNGNVDAEFKAAMDGLTKAGARRIVLDLRNNPGGLLDSAVNIASWFLPSDSLVVMEKFGDGSSDELRSRPVAGDHEKLPVIVLINGGSASASEILAGALHDIRGIRLVGEKTFGKGSVQQLEQFSDGSSLKVTVAKWLTPNGVSITDEGIVPTDEVVMDPAQAQEKGWELGTPGKDPQLDKALEILPNL